LNSYDKIFNVQKIEKFQEVHKIIKQRLWRVGW